MGNYLYIFYIKYYKKNFKSYPSLNNLQRKRGRGLFEKQKFVLPQGSRYVV